MRREGTCLGRSEEFRPIRRASFPVEFQKQGDLSVTRARYEEEEIIADEAKAGEAPINADLPEARHRRAELRALESRVRRHGCLRRQAAIGDGGGEPTPEDAGRRPGAGRFGAEGASDEKVPRPARRRAAEPLVDGRERRQPAPRLPPCGPEPRRGAPRLARPVRRVRALPCGPGGGSRRGIVSAMATCACAFCGGGRNSSSTPSAPAAYTTEGGPKAPPNFARRAGGISSDRDSDILSLHSSCAGHQKS